MRKHTLEATGGKTYSQMDRFMGKDGKSTSDEKLAAIDPKSGKPVDNPLRNLWVSETALTTALHSSYFAESVATFAIVMGFALMLTGGGFLVLTLRVLRVFGKETASETVAARAGQGRASAAEHDPRMVPVPHSEAPLHQGGFGAPRAAPRRRRRRRRRRSGDARGAAGTRRAPGRADPRRARGALQRAPCAGPCWSATRCMSWPPTSTRPCCATPSPASMATSAPCGLPRERGWPTTCSSSRSAPRPARSSSAACASRAPTNPMPSRRSSPTCAPRGRPTSRSSSRRARRGRCRPTSSRSRSPRSTPRRHVTLITPEHEPLEAFGPPATALVRSELAAAGVWLLCGVDAVVTHPNVVEVAPGASCRATSSCTCRRSPGRGSRAWPATATASSSSTTASAPAAPDDLYAIGDATATARKQGGLAAQQADLVAEQIAQRAGAEHAPRPYRPVLRGLLRTAHGPRYLRAGPPGAAPSAEVSEQCLWWPPGPVAARWLVPWLAARARRSAPLPSPRRMPSGAISRAAHR